MPRTMYVTFQWATQLVLTESAAGIGEVYAFRLNSLFDPNATGVGDQPVGYDQWAELFRRSVVYSASVDVEAMVTGQVNTPSVVGMFPLIGASTVPSGISLDSQYRCTNHMRSNGTVPLKLRGNYDFAQLCGIPKQRLFDEEGYSEVMGTGPAISANRQVLLYLYCRGFHLAAIATYRVRITFRAKLFEPRCLNNS